MKEFIEYLWENRLFVRNSLENFKQSISQSIARGLASDEWSLNGKENS